MLSKTKWMALCAAVCGSFILSPSQQVMAQPAKTTKADKKQAQYAPDRIIIKLKTPDFSTGEQVRQAATSMTAQLKAVGLSVTQIFGDASSTAFKYAATSQYDGAPQIYSAVITDKNLSVDDAVKKALATGLVETAEVDFIQEKHAVPNDTELNKQWYLNNAGQLGTGTIAGRTGFDIRAFDAWSTYTGKASNVVAVIDSGVLGTHPDLTANMWVNPNEIAGNNIDDDADGFIDNVFGVDVGANDGNPTPNATAASSHGTAVSGVIAAAGNNGIGISGVSWSTKIMAVKVESSAGTILTSSLISAVDFVRKKKNAGVNVRVANISIGSYGYSTLYKDALKAAGNSGILFTVSAGNDGLDSSVVHSYPSGYKLGNVVSVAASDSQGNLTSFSNYGADVDIVAPGQDIYTTGFTVTNGIVSAGYGYIDGTSFSSPIVAGVASLILAREPNLSMAQLKERLLTRGAEQLGSPLSASLSGAVRTNRHINAARGVSTADCLSAKPVVLRPLKNTNTWVQGANHTVEVLVGGCQGSTANVSVVSTALGIGGAPLKDNGVFPDTLANDGVFTGVVVPKNAQGSANFTVLSKAGTSQLSSSATPVYITSPINYRYAPNTSVSFTSIGSTGTRLSTVSSGDDEAQAVTLPFSIPFYGRPWSSFFVSGNGRICFQDLAACADPAGTVYRSSDGVYRFNDPVPTGRKSPASAAYIAPWWADWAPYKSSDSLDGVFVKTAGVAPNRTFTVSWEGIESINVVKNSFIVGNGFQVVFYEGKSYFDMAYRWTDEGDEAYGAIGSTGVQSYNGNIGTQFNYNGSKKLDSHTTYRWTPSSPSFTDTSAWMSDIEGLKGSGLTPGCTGEGSTTFCPNNTLVRGAMAVWIDKAIEGSAFYAPPTPTGRFTDAPISHPWAAYIEDFAFNKKLSPGCNGVGSTAFCTQSPVTRGALAVWIVKAIKGGTYVPPTAVGYFSDAPVGHPWAAYIEDFKRMGISPGCAGETGTKFCTQDSISRASAAAWLQRAFRFHDYR